MGDLQLAVKREYFEQIKSGDKKHEYRLRNAYWAKRLVGREYNEVVITLGYLKRGDTERTLVFPYRGFFRTTITHNHFGEQSVDVYAIILEQPQ